MTAVETISDNIKAIRERAENALKRAGRKSGEISVMAVTKFQPFEAVLAAYGEGIRLFGENRVQEALGKFPPDFKARAPSAQLHMIGSLQRNKVNKSLSLFDGIDSVDSQELLDAILGKTERTSATRTLLFELRTGESSKSGFDDEDGLSRAMESYLRHSADHADPNAPRCIGLMTMAPLVDDEKAIRAAFRKLKHAHELIRNRFELKGFDVLSMGMSGDFEIAIEEGSTLIRIGSAIFGAR